MLLYLEGYKSFFANHELSVTLVCVLPASDTVEGGRGGREKARSPAERFKG